MAKRIDLPQGSWLMAEELLQSGDLSFVDELCTIHDADRLGSFAKTWYTNRQPQSRRLMIEYLNRPLATYRHEALVKRLFKLAEAAADDEMMGVFMVALDRTIRRVRKTRHRYDWQTRESWDEETIQIPRHSTVPRADGIQFTTHQLSRANPLRLFSVATRSYLRRRVWRYFRSIGKQDPQRYAAAIGRAIVRYTDEDCHNGLVLIDNYALTHALFHHSELLVDQSSCWMLADGKSLSELKPAPAFATAWQQNADALIEVLGAAQSRCVRQWAIQLIRAHHPTAILRLPITILLQWIANTDDELALLAAESLGKANNLGSVSVNDWLRLLEAANPQVLDPVCATIQRCIAPEAVSLDEKIKLACARPIPLVRLAMQWLESVSVRSPEDCRILLQVSEAEAGSLRPELVQGVCDRIKASGFRDANWILELLDARHADVRAVGWDWLLTDDKYSNDISIWHRLLETPYDNVRMKLIELLSRRAGDAKQTSAQIVCVDKLDAGLVRTLWATVLLNIQRGGKRKPAIVQAIVERLRQCPGDAEQLLPLLAVALRSVRSVEFRSGLAGVVQLVQRRPEMSGLVAEKFPELEITSSPSG